MEECAGSCQQLFGPLALSTFTFFKPDQNGNYIAFIQCMTVGFASVIVCFASMSADFAKEAVVFV